MTNTIKTLTEIGKCMSESASDPRTATNIRLMHSTEQGAEILRLIVRDNLGGAGELIVSSLLN